MDSATFVRAVEELRDMQGCAPTTGDVPAALGIYRSHAWRCLRAIPELFAVPSNPAPRWEVRGGLSLASARVHALVTEAGELVRHLDAHAADLLRGQLLQALAGRR
jgi:hypothetical protein